MPGPLYHVGAVALCPHGGQVQTIAASPRVTVSGMPVAVLTDTSLVAGCVFTIGTKPSPCLRVQWVMGATRVTSMGQPVLLQSAVGLCLSPEQAPQGPATIVSTQPRVIGM
jgi:uncharacterized Zn-binding protein involved in type VI secretion